MKKIYLLLLLGFILNKTSQSQILCINCYNQNNTLSPGALNLITNGSFENTPCIPWSYSGVFCPNSTYYTCNINNWVCTDGGASTYACMMTSAQSVIPDGTLAAYLGNNFASTCSSLQSDTSCLVNTGCEITSMPPGYPYNTIGYGGSNGVSLQQTVNGLVIGNTYVLEFWVGGERNGIIVNGGVFAVDLGFGKRFLKCYATGFFGVGVRYIIEFKATSTSHTIKFTNWGHASSTGTELVLDDVKLYTLQELPSSVPNCALGIKEMSSIPNVELFPNPCKGTFSLQLNEKLENGEMILFNNLGQKIFSQEIPELNNVISAENLTPGLYFFQLRSDDKEVRQGKIIFE